MEWASLEVYEFQVAVFGAVNDVGDYPFYALVDGDEVDAPNQSRVLRMTLDVLGCDITNSATSTAGRAFTTKLEVSVRVTCRKDSTAVITAGIDDVETLLAYSGFDQFAVGDLLRLEDEEVEITAVTPASNEITVTRGEHGTTAVAHALNTPIFFAANAVEIDSTETRHEEAAVSGALVDYRLERYDDHKWRIVPTCEAPSSTLMVFYVWATFRICTTAIGDPP